MKTLFYGLMTVAYIFGATSVEASRIARTKSTPGNVVKKVLEEDTGVKRTESASKAKIPVASIKSEEPSNSSDNDDTVSSSDDDRFGNDTGYEHQQSKQSKLTAANSIEEPSDSSDIELILDDDNDDRFYNNDPEHEHHKGEQSRFTAALSIKAEHKSWCDESSTEIDRSELDLDVNLHTITDEIIAYPNIQGNDIRMVIRSRNNFFDYLLNEKRNINNINGFRNTVQNFNLDNDTIDTILMERIKRKFGNNSEQVDKISKFYGRNAAIDGMSRETKFLGKIKDGVIWNAQNRRIAGAYASVVDEKADYYTTVPMFIEVLLFVPVNSALGKFVFMNCDGSKPTPSKSFFEFIKAAGVPINASLQALEDSGLGFKIYLLDDKQ